ncbi:MAG: hypothetical protein MOB07_23195 [Acidobacteria bacterium]|nr:hypothetical protein [Acidobacteriota bacterium]
MPRILPDGLLPAINRINANIETHSTLQLQIPASSGIQVSQYWATAGLDIGGVPYQSVLREGGLVKSSLTRAADRVEVQLQNVDVTLGVTLLQLQDVLCGAEVKFGRFWRDAQGTEYQKTILTGVVAGVELDENFVRLILLSDAYAAVSVGASRRVVRLCQFRYKDPSTCQFVGTPPDCNFMLNDAGGCHGRHGDPLKRAKYGGYVFIESKSSVAGAAGTPVPAFNQLIRQSDGTAFKQQPFTKIVGATITNEDGNLQTVVTVTGTGANTALSNLAAVAINTSLLPGTGGAIDLGSDVKGWRDLYLLGAIKEGNNAKLLDFVIALLPVNFFTIGSAAAGAAPRLIASGSDTNIPMLFQTKGAGSVLVDGPASDAGIAVNIRRRDQTGRNFRFAPSVNKNATHDPHLDMSSGQSYSAGLFLEQTGTILSYAINGIAQLNSRDTTRVGGLFRLDTRTGIGLSNGEQSFIIIGVATGGSSELARLICSLQNGNTLLNPNGGTTGINLTAAAGAQLEVKSGATDRVALKVNTPASPTVDLAQFYTNDSLKLAIKNNGFIVGVPKNVETNTTLTGNITTGLDSLHSFSLPADSLANNKDHLKVKYSGRFATNEPDKRIRVTFGGVQVHDLTFDQDFGEWRYEISYVRLTSTTVRASFELLWGFFTRDGAAALGGLIAHAAGDLDITVSNLNSNAMTMLVQAEATNTDDVIQTLSIIDLTQVT